MTLEAAATTPGTLRAVLQSVSNLKEKDEGSARAELNKPAVEGWLRTWSRADAMLLGFRELRKDRDFCLHLARDFVWSHYSNHC